MGGGQSKVGAGPRKILFLGAHQSGKTVLSLRLGELLSVPPDEKEVLSFRKAIRLFILQSFKDALRNVGQDSIKKNHPDKFKYYRILLEHESKSDLIPEFVLNSMHQLYDVDIIRWSLRSHDLQYFMQHLDRIYASSYTPTCQDMIHYYKPTPDMRELIKVGDAKSPAVKVVEIAGSRYARRRWIQSLERFETIVFTASALHYKFGPEFEESVTFFETVCNSRLFSGSNIILVFTHTDQLKRQLLNDSEKYRLTMVSLTSRYFEVAQRKTPVFELDLAESLTSQELIKMLL